MNNSLNSFFQDERIERERERARARDGETDGRTGALDTAEKRREEKRREEKRRDLLSFVSIKFKIMKLVAHFLSQPEHSLVRRDDREDGRSDEER